MSRTWSLSYSTTGGNLAGVSFPPVGATSPVAYGVSLSYNSDHDITGYTDLRGKTWNYTYDSDDNSLLSETDPLSHTTTYAYTSTSSPTITD